MIVVQPMLALIQATDPEGTLGIFKMVSEGGALVLLGFILWTLARRMPAIADRISEGHAKAIETMTVAHAKAIDTFAAESREARLLYRQEQEAARQQTGAIIRDERAACEARHARIEARLDEHSKHLEKVGTALTQLIERERK